MGKVNDNAKKLTPDKKIWTKPKFLSGKDIGFLGMGFGQAYSTGPYGTTPS
jgi:hypothetical protein